MIICSYPCSGSSWLRFILCHLLYPDQEIDFDFVNRAVPDIDDPTAMRHAIDHPVYFKSHGFRNCTDIVFLHRHVGDVLISEWWYKRKFHAEQRSFEEFSIACDYGQGWRQHVEWYFPSILSIRFDELDKALAISRVISYEYDFSKVKRAIERSDFSAMREVEKKGFGPLYPSGDLSIPFIRSGKSGQWKELSEATQLAIFDKNYNQLKVLGYL